MKLVRRVVVGMSLVEVFSLLGERGVFVVAMVG